VRDFLEAGVGPATSLSDRRPAQVARCAPRATAATPPRGDLDMSRRRAPSLRAWSSPTGDSAMSRCPW
jgi:hypothetical protein